MRGSVALLIAGLAMISLNLTCTCTFCLQLQDWLVNHGSEESLSADDRTRYSKQLDILRSVCSIYESSDESATDASKKERYETILQLMQQVQIYGPSLN